ncbi:MAG: hypothetical protein WHS77_01965 [Brevinematales bacterium]
MKKINSFIITMFFLCSCSIRSSVLYYKPDTTISINRIKISEIDLKNSSALEVPKDVVSNIILENLKLAFFQEGITVVLDETYSNETPELFIKLIGKRNDFINNKQYFSLIYKLVYKKEDVFYLIQDFDGGVSFLRNEILFDSLKEAIKNMKQMQKEKK